MVVETISRHPVPAGRLPDLAFVSVAVRGLRRGVVIWGAVYGLMAWALVSQFGKEYPTAAARAELTATMGSSVGLQAIFGKAHHLNTVAGYTAYHLIGVFGIIGALWGLLAAARVLRGEEEAGRWELLLAGRTTRRRAAAGALTGLGAGALALWIVAAAATVALGRSSDARFSVTASLFAATAAVVPAALFLAVGALCSQLAATRRQAAGLAAGVFGFVYLIRLVANSSASLRGLGWVSPLVWVDELHPLTGSRALFLVPIVTAIAALTAATVLLAGGRDLGAGVLRAQQRTAARTRTLNGPLGLATRLARRAAVGWIAGLAVGGLILGLSAKGSATVWASQSDGIAAKLGGTAGGAAYLGVGFLIVTLVVGLAAAAQVGATREEEADGYLDHLLARSVARVPWLAGRFAVSALVLAVAGLATGLIAWIGAAATGVGLGVATLVAAGVNAVPAGVFVLGVGTLLHGLAPRFAAVAAYGVVAWSFLVEIVGAGLGANRWLLDTSVLHHIARAPAVGVRWDADVMLMALGLAAAALGALALARRDLKGA